MDKDLLEGRDYQCAFYGGSLLSSLDANSKKEDLDPKKVDLLSINRNLYIICDSDKINETSEYKSRVKNIKKNN